MYGIMTTGSKWMFIHWAGKSEDLTIQLMPKLPCLFEDLTSTKDILNHITGILENQLESLDNLNPSKRIKIGDHSV